MNAARLALIIGALGLIGWGVMALFDVQVMPSYLAAWLFWVAIPLGALPLVMVLEALGGSGAVVATLRRLLLLLPVGALLAIPFLLATGQLFRRAEGPSRLPVAWLNPPLFAARTVAILVVLSLLALVFSRAPKREPRRFLASIGLILHVCLMSVAAVDWLLSLSPGLGSSELGLLLIMAQMGVAGCMAGFVIGFGSAGATGQTALGPLLATLLGAWAFLHFVQFLVVWSANLPAEVVWYNARAPGLGGATIAFAAVAALVALVVLPTRLAQVPAILASLTAMLLLVHLLETLWLITPAFRGRFTVGLADVFAMVGLGGLAVAGLVPLMGVRRATA